MFGPNFERYVEPTEAVVSAFVASRTSLAHVTGLVGNGCNCSNPVV
jgi:hypothetical protein